MPVSYANNASTLLASPIDASATVILLATGTGDMFPSLPTGWYFFGTLESADGNDIEIVRVTSRSVDALTVVRGQDSTMAVPFSAGDKFEVRTTKALLDEFGQLHGDNVWTGDNHFANLTLDSLSLTEPLSVPNGGTGRSSLSAEYLLVGNGTDDVNLIPPGTNGMVLTSVGGSWVAAASGVPVFPLTVDKGGTGRDTLTDKSLLVGAGTANVGLIAPGTNGQVLVSDGSQWLAGAPPSASAVIPDGAYIGMVVFTADGTYTPSANARVIEVTVVAGGGNTLSADAEWPGGFGGVSIGKLTLPGGTIVVFVGGVGESSSILSISCTPGGDGVLFSTPSNGVGSGGALNTYGAYLHYGASDQPGIVLIREYA